MKSPILHELTRHAPFTLAGALSGVVLMALLWNLPYKEAHGIFYVLHPAHVVLSALVTASLYSNYKCTTDKHHCNIAALVAVGFVGSIGIATLSDSIIPFLGEKLLHMPHAEPHIGFIERPWLIIPLAGAGILIAYFRPRTKFPHAGHVLISTWASLFHVLMAKGAMGGMLFFSALFVFLFVAVWLPCCISDIVFPLLFVNKKDLKERAG